MASHYPPPEEYERERQRLDVIRPWHRIGWVLLGVLGVVAVALTLREIAGG